LGCDIHIFIEHKSKSSSVWYGFGGEIFLPRNYNLFGLLAGVRGGDSIFPPRGIPDDIDITCQECWFIRVNDDLVAHDGYCSESDAKYWVSMGCSTPVYHGDTLNILKVSGPDWHTPSWLNLEEYEQVLKVLESKYEAEGYNSIDPSYYAILGAMAAFREVDHESRIVFWFDN